MANILCLFSHLWKVSTNGKQRECGRSGCDKKQKLIKGRWFNYTPLNKPVKKFISKAHLIKDNDNNS